MSPTAASSSPPRACRALSVSRETPAALVARFGLPAAAADQIESLLGALFAEPDPPTTVRVPGHALDAHVADSLSGLEIQGLREAEAVADIGAGAGFPGLALAVAMPGTRFDLIEATARKCATIDRLAFAAGLENVRAVPARAEEWAAGEGAEAYAAVTARALAPLAVLTEYAAPLLRIGGVLVAWKGARDAAEEASGRTAAETLGLEPLEILAVRPFEGARDRHLHAFQKVGSTPTGYPRRAGMARKRPLG